MSPAPDIDPVGHATEMLLRSAVTLVEVVTALTKTPKPKERAALRRRLSGVIADVETVRVAIKE